MMATLREIARQVLAAWMAPWMAPAHAPVQAMIPAGPTLQESMMRIDTTLLIDGLLKLITGIVLAAPHDTLDQHVAKVEQALQFSGVLEQLDDTILKLLVELAMLLGKPIPTGGGFAVRIRDLIATLSGLAIAIAQADLDTDLDAFARGLDHAIELPLPLELIDHYVFRGVLEVAMFIARRKLAAGTA